MEPLTLGQRYTLPVRFSQADVEAFMAVTGDHNPLHWDADYAATTPFKRPIVHGMLSAAVFSRILGTLFPGEGTIYLGQSLKFQAPMYVDTDYLATLEITGVEARRHRAQIATTLATLEGSITLSGEAEVMHRQRF
ncbi:MAG: MaoC family dehydratase [Candidatus Sericytochromatia bacterium]